MRATTNRDDECARDVHFVYPMRDGAEEPRLDVDGAGDWNDARATSENLRVSRRPDATRRSVDGWTYTSLDVVREVYRLVVSMVV